MENSAAGRAKTRAEKQWEEAGGEGSYIEELRRTLVQLEAMDSDSSVIRQGRAYLLKSILEAEAGADSATPEATRSTGPPKMLIDLIKTVKTEGDPLEMLGNYEELQHMYEEGGLVGAAEGETLIFRGGNFIGRFPHGESFVAQENDESRIPYMHWIIGDSDKVFYQMAQSPVHLPNNPGGH